MPARAALGRTAPVARDLQPIGADDDLSFCARPHSRRRAGRRIRDRPAAVEAADLDLRRRRRDAGDVDPRHARGRDGRSGGDTRDAGRHGGAAEAALARPALDAAGLRRARGAARDSARHGHGAGAAAARAAAGTARHRVRRGEAAREAEAAHAAVLGLRRGDPSRAAEGRRHREDVAGRISARRSPVGRRRSAGARSAMRSTRGRTSGSPRRCPRRRACAATSWSVAA